MNAKMPGLPEKTHDAQVLAMDAIFALNEAINDNNLSIGDLADVIKLAVADGHGTILMTLGMASAAIALAGDKSEEHAKISKAMMSFLRGDSQ